MRSAILIAVFAVFAWRVHQRTADWRSNLTIWAAAVATTPCQVRPHVQLAAAETAVEHDDAAQREWRAVALLIVDHTCVQ